MKLKKYLKLYRIKQKDFAVKAGIKDSHLSLIVNNKAMPSIKVAQQIANLTEGNVTVNDY